MQRLYFATFVVGAALLCGHAEAGEPPAPLPQTLRDTGLFAAGSSATEIRPEIVSFSPQYPLWSDGATKRRWLHLPPDSFIDAAQVDAWEFPNGTRLWKEFSFDRRVETRLIERLEDGSWRFATYVWDDDGRDATLAPAEGIRALPVAGAPGGRYSIPAEADCRACHEGARTPVLGLSALQLSPERDPLAPHAEPLTSNQLQELVERGWLRNLPERLLDQPPRLPAASPVERAVLGYLHGNCGHCHGAPSAMGAAVPVPVRLEQSAADPVHGVTSALRSLVGAVSRFQLPAVGTHVIAPGSATQSVLPARMRSRDPRVQMPPLGTAIADQEAMALIERWIEDLPQQKEEPRP